MTLSLPPAYADETGSVRFTPRLHFANIPPRYRLDDHEFSFVLTRKKEYPTCCLDVFDLQFPSPLQSAVAENNTVHAEYYRPHGDGPFPGVIVLDITGGDQTLSRVMARHLAQKKIAALFVQMAYYGPRRPKGSSARLLSPDVEHTLEAVRQTVLDLRRATAWLESRREIDKRRLGIMGTSLGSFVAALTAEVEPKLSRVCVVLGGGGFIDGYYDHPQVAPFRKTWESLGGTKELLTKTLAPVDPLTLAENLKDRKVLIVAARNDEIVPPRMAEALWRASGRQQILWLNAGHFTAAIYLLPGLDHITRHFAAP